MVLRLIALPSVGGNRYSLNALKRNLPEAVDFVPVELPGRGLRSDAPLLRGMADLTNDVYDQVKTHLNAPYALYGHCMGALLAWLLVEKVARENGKLPLHLFVYGCAGPAALQNRQTQALPRQEFIKILAELGTPVELLANESFFEAMEPVFRADFQAFNEYQYQERTSIQLPMTVLYGKDDPAYVARVKLWQKETSWPVLFERVPPGANVTARVVNLVAETLPGQAVTEKTRRPN